MRLSTKSTAFNGFGNMAQLVSGSGMPVSYETALQDPTVKACIRIIAQTISTLPLKLYKYQNVTTGKDWLEDTTSLMSHVITIRPNVRQTSAEFVEQMIAQLMLYSEFYAQVRKAPNGKITGIIPFNSPKQVAAYERGDDIIYKCTTNDNKSITLKNDELFVVRDLSLDTFQAIDKIRAAKSTIGLSLAATHNAENYYKRGPRAGAFIETTTRLNDNEYARVQSQFNEAYTGNENAHKIAILENGMKYVANHYTLKDAQVLESRDAAIREIAAIFGVPMALLGVDDKSAANIENINNFFYRSCLQSIIHKIEQRFLLILPYGYAVKFDTAEYLRGDAKTTTDNARQLFERGLISHPEARKMIGLQPVNDDLWVIGSNNLAFGKLEDFGKNNPTLDVNQTTTQDS